jgi:hypothetical protein
MTKSLMDLKTVLYDMLTTLTKNDTEGDPVAITQQLGIQMSKAVQRDGVNVIQLQNVHLSRIVPHLIDGMKLIDSIALGTPQEVIELKQIEHVVEEEEDDDPIDSCCKFMYDQGIKWKEMQELMKARYAEFVRGEFDHGSEAADFLGIQRTYYSKVLRAAKEKE